MGGGLMQLVAYGAQDIYLTSNPQITFFKVVYRRHTNFSTEMIEQTFTGTAGSGKNINVTISRNGDLVNRLYLECDGSFSATNGCLTVPSNPGNSMIDYVELEIGGQTIDKLYGHWMEVWARLTEPNPTGSVGLINASSQAAVGSNLTNVAVNIGGGGGGGAYDTSALGDTNSSGVIFTPITKYQSMACAGGVSNQNHFALGFNSRLTQGCFVPKYSVPLPFWFCKNPGLALPLIALQYHEVKLDIKFSSTGFSSAMADVFNPKVWAEYIYLDTAERRRFAQVSHEYLIEQVQRYDQNSKAAAGGKVADMTLDLNFNHPVKELIFTSDFNASSVESFGSLPGWAEKDTNVTLTLNGHDRFSAERRWDYFSRTQLWEHHTGPGNLFGGNEGYLNGVCESAVAGGGQWGGARADQIGVYSFALKPEEHQPSGTCNFSRIDSTRLTLKNMTAVTGSTVPLVVYAINYNVLRIMSGMGGLAYSN
jgi:hypothetical protein